MKRLGKGICLVAAALVVVGLGLWLLPPSVLPPTAVAVQFVTYTNAGDGSRLALFAVTNTSARAICYVAGGPQVRRGREWPEEVVLPGSVPAPNLQAGGGAYLCVAPPTNGGAWRVPVLWDVMPSRLDWLKETVRQNAIALRTGERLPGGAVGIRGSWHTNFASDGRR